MSKPIIGPVVKKGVDFFVNRQINSISSHFSQFLQPVLADSTELKHAVYNVRHNVYCEELKFEPENNEKLERDEFDPFSLHCLIKHKSSESFAGTVRIVRPKVPGEILPIQKYCKGAITNTALDPDNFEPHQVCEISRLAVPSKFRRREMDKFAGAATGGINEVVYSEKELRCFPFIAIGLYFCAASTVILEQVEHTYVMMEPRLARSMGFVGIKFEQIGPVVDYHGKRAPYYINVALLMKNLPPHFKNMLFAIEESLADQHGGQVVYA
ncbi:PEP-CTERM/exosortase system-associated acyltransferase [Alteromonas sp. SM 2104]|nr:PEP-CTERM/exosortase system-associated acyltransferase [Alteromonas oceanisediminis]MBT0585689.1 PEP-CTERM/exosortase system-associated acyltransferase [Alteromonas oceanisediminis]